MPAFGLRFLGEASQLVTRKPVEKIDIGEEPTALRIKQIADDETARFLIATGSNKASAAIIGTHLSLAQGANDGLSATIEGR